MRISIAALKDAVCLFRHPSVVYAPANLHRGPARVAGPRGRTTRARHGGARVATTTCASARITSPPAVSPRERSSATSFIAIVRTDRRLPHRVEMLSLSAHTHRECNKRLEYYILLFCRSYNDRFTIRRTIMMH